MSHDQPRVWTLQGDRHWPTTGVDGLALEHGERVAVMDVETVRRLLKDCELYVDPRAALHVELSTVLRLLEPYA